MSRLSPSAALFVLASILISFLAASSAPTPLYPVYQAAWGFSPITITVVFGSYAIAVLVALLTLGSLSDYIGRRPVLITAVLVQAGAMAMFATADSVAGLLAARIVQGLATGAAAGAVGGALLDLDRERGALANAIAPPIGTGLGALASGLLVQYLPAPTQLVYAALLVILVGQAIGVALMRETSPRRPGALRSLRPQLRLPPSVRTPMLVAAPALIASWALVGFYGSLGPTLVRQLAGTSSFAIGGLALFALACGGVIGASTTRSRSPRVAMSIGSAALVAGVALTGLAIGLGSIAGFFAGTVIAGAGFGAPFQAAIRMVTPFALPNERAGVLSVLFTIAYLAMGVPAVLGGLGTVYGGGVIATAREYGVAVIVFAIAAFIATALRDRGLRRVLQPIPSLTRHL